MNKSMNNKASLSEHSRNWHKQPMVWMIITIPAISVIVGMLMLMLAIRSDDGLVVDDYYQHGKEINRVLERDQLAAEYGLQARFRLLEKNQVVVALSHHP